ncbi:glycosyltransferase family 4 protein [Arenibacter latericius]|uniref:glycosyltransferase family 4 protein n=1 Tax=Arenibacter latericius TaxID=86104 RepID=UPI00041FDE13|nr:glycosyltransferase family 4 protein [Arenibacter latericius]MDX1362950.1 glycosyltransferase family 4 protein [Arenibacter latericius]
MQKVLIITYYWPPAGGPGVQRWLKFVKYLPHFNVEPIVYVPQNPNYPITDDSFTNAVPTGVKVYKKKIFEPYGLASIFSKKKTKQISSGIIPTKNQTLLEKLLLWIRGNLFIPDARKFWVKPSVKFLSQLIEEENISTIITTGPPHSVHLIGQQLKRKSKVQWIADFRDPWTSIGYHDKLMLTAASQKKHKQIERAVLNEADKIIVTSNTTKLEFTQLTNKPIAVITNGFDSYEEAPISLDSTFTISHIGSLLSGRDPLHLWKALSELVAENEAFKQSLRIKLAGVISKDVLKSIRSCGLEPYLDLLGYLSHKEALQLQRSSQVLLLLEIDSDETKGIIPGKVFEYMAAKRPILGVGPTDWEVSNLVEASNTGKIFDYNQFKEIKGILLQWFEQYKKGELELPLAKTDQFHRKELTAKLVKYIGKWE